MGELTTPAPNDLQMLTVLDLYCTPELDHFHQ